MFTRNVGTLDSVIRIVAGLALIAGFFLWMSAVWSWALLVVGIILLATGAMRSCPLYSMIGMSTCPTRQS